MKTKFKIGDRVKCILPQANSWFPDKGKIYQVDQDEYLFGNVLDVKGSLVIVQKDSGATGSFHYRMCIKLKPKPKSVRITKEQLASVWDREMVSNFNSCSPQFEMLARALGL